MPIYGINRRQEVVIPVESILVVQVDLIFGMGGGTDPFLVVSTMISCAQYIAEVFVIAVKGL